MADAQDNVPRSEAAENGSHEDQQPSLEEGDHDPEQSRKRPSPDGVNSADSCRKLFVGGLNRGTTDDGLRDYFAQFGEIESCLIKCDPTTNRSRGFGFVTFKNRASVDKVVSTTHMLDERKIDPKLAVPYPKSKTRKIFVGGLPAELAEPQLRAYFGKFGPVDEVELPVDRNTGGRKGFGFVSFESEEAVELAMKQTFHTISEFTVEVKRAVVKDQQQMPATQRGRGPMNNSQQAFGTHAMASPAGYSAAMGSAAYQQQYGGAQAAAQAAYGAYGQMYNPYQFSPAYPTYPYYAYNPYAGVAYGQQVQSAQPQQQQQQQQYAAFTPTVAAATDSSSRYGPVRNNSTTQSTYRPY